MGGAVSQQKPRKAQLASVSAVALMSAHGSEAPEKLKSSFILLPAFSRCFQLFSPSFWLRHCATGALVSCWNVSRKCQSKLSDCSICQEKRVKLKLFSLVSTQVPKLWSEYLPDSLTYNRNVIAAVRLFPPALFSDPVRFSTLVFFLFFFFYLSPQFVLLGVVSSDRISSR